ncbi:MAG: penicillin-binding protein 1B [Arenicellales bacterium]|nr:penicillin-binding protein 1B [Arenicellales bacterium]
MASKKSRRRKNSGKKRSKSRSKRAKRGRFWIRRLALLAVVTLIGYAVYLDITVRKKFEGSRWAIPAHVYSRPLELYVGLKLTKPQLVQELKLLGYRNSKNASTPGSYTVTGKGVRIYVRSFDFWDGPSQAQLVDVGIKGNVVNGLSGIDRTPVGDLRLEPHLYGSISPGHHEDRSLVRLEDVPEPLINALLAIEDRNFFNHVGIDPRGLLRATLANISAGSVVQGGSTLTQQLVKNFYLSHERTLQRKLTEMMMAVLLEVHYDKDEILETYINEVYLGQSGNKAIHGFGLASFYYFGRPLNELKPAESALLVALVKGASYYNPFRSPDRAKQRRDLVLTKMAELGYLDDAVATAAKQAPLGVTRQGKWSKSDYPGYLDFVRLQLRRDYQEEDLRTEGLHIFTTLDPLIQRTLERSVSHRLATLEKSRKMKAGSLQAAALVVRTDNGEVVALVGDRRARFIGFNRALEAERQIGSLIKPAVYLAAIERGYSLASLVDDGPLVVEQQGAATWRPQNYDKKNHGSVRVLDALSYSYNIATIRLGLEVGVDKVANLLQRLGLSREIKPYPSLLLGAVNMTPVEMAQMYLGFASGGFRMPLRTTRSVLTQDMQPLARYPLSLEQAVSGEPISVLNFALQSVVRKGTAKGLNQRFPAELELAGKTGTTDRYRDSWFAGYAGNYLAVVWVGRDDNASTGLTGASGAMRIWSDVMAELPLQPVDLPIPEGVEFVEVDQYGLLARGCPGATLLPFVKGTIPQQKSPCAGGGTRASVSTPTKNWIEKLFDTSNK